MKNDWFLWHNPKKPNSKPSLMFRNEYYGFNELLPNGDFVEHILFNGDIVKSTVMYNIGENKDGTNTIAR